MGVHIAPTRRSDLLGATHIAHENLSIVLSTSLRARHLARAHLSVASHQSPPLNMPQALQEAEFCSLDEWGREAALFMKVRALSQGVALAMRSSAAALTFQRFPIYLG